MLAVIVPAVGAVVMAGAANPSAWALGDLAQTQVGSAQSVAQSSTRVTFSGKYSGNAALLINNGSVTISSVNGKGTGTLVGVSTISGLGSGSSAQQCNDWFTGTGAITGTSGKIDLKVLRSKSSACANGTSGPVKVTFSGVATATGGTGKASGAQGSLEFKGDLNLAGVSGSQNGHYTVTLSGQLTVK